MELVTAYNNSTNAAATSKSSAPASSSQVPQNSGKATTTSNTKDSLEHSLQRTLENIDLPEVANGSARVELNFNQDTGRVIAKVTDRSSGEVLREIPSKELQQLFAQMRDYLGSVVDKEI